MTFDETQLRAYLAGDLPTDTAKALEAALEQDDALADRLLELDQEMAAPVRAAMMEMPTQARLDRLEAAIPESVDATAKGGPLRWAPLVAASAAAFALGAFLFGSQTSDIPERWQDQAAIYQALYVTETVAPLDFSADVVAQQLEISSAALGRTLPLDIVSDLDGLTLKRSQILGFEGAPLIQLAYVNADGVPVALCAVRLGEDNASAATFETLAGLPAAHWSDGDFSYMLIGDLPQAQIQSLATDLQRRL